MIVAIEAGEVSHVLVKDLSRVGRDYLQVGFYTEVMFREHGVRFVAIANGVDSDKRESSEFAPFLNIMNEWYVRDSSRKIKSVLRAKGMSGIHTNSIPYLTLQSNDFGIYQTDNRGIYYDGNFIEFRNSGGTQDINIVLSKVFKHTSDVFDLSADELQFTEINGRELAVFHYTNENGTDCYYAEFLQNDVAFVVSSENISMEDYAKCLQVLVEKAQQNSGSVNTITGEIVVIDAYANHIGVRLDKEQAPEYSSVYGIDLPDGQSAGDYSLGDRVEVMYTGEPATILTIWAEQLVDIKLLK